MQTLLKLGLIFLLFHCPDPGVGFPMEENQRIAVTLTLLATHLHMATAHLDVTPSKFIKRAVDNSFGSILNFDPTQEYEQKMWTPGPPDAPLAREIDYSPETEPIVEEYEGFTVTRNNNQASFVELGYVVPTRGAAHLHASVNLKAQYQAIDVVLKIARQLFTEHLFKQGIELATTQSLPSDFPGPRPPSPEHIFTLRHENYIKTYLPYLNHTGNLTGSQAIKAFYYLNPDLQNALVKMYTSWTDQANHRVEFASFDAFMTAQEESQPILSSITEYLMINNGPYPHLRDNMGVSILRQNESFALDLGQLLHRAAQLKLETAAQADLGSALGRSSIHKERLYLPDERVPQFVGDAYKMSPAPSTFKRTSPNPHANVFRQKRFIAMITLGLLAVGALAFSSTVMGAYSVNQLAVIKAQAKASNEATLMTAETVDTLAKNQESMHDTVNFLGEQFIHLHNNLVKHQQLVARHVDSTNHRFDEVANKLNSLQTYVDQEVQALANQVHFLRVAVSLSIHLEEVADQVHRTAALLDSLGHRRVTSAFASSFALQEATRQITLDVAAQGNQLLVQNYGDIFQCEASYTLTSETLDIVVHLPVGRPQERMTLWEFIPYPWSSQGAIASVDHKDNYLAANDDLSLFKGFSPRELASCNKIGRTHICPMGTIFRTSANFKDRKERSPETCLFALYTKDYDKIANNCHMLIYPPYTQVTKVGENTFRIATRDINEGPGTVDCKTGHPQIVTLSENFDISLKAGCTAKILGHYMFAGDALNYEVSTTRTVTLNWDPAVIFGMMDAAPRLRRHADSLVDSLLPSPYTPAPLEAVPSLYNRVYDKLTNPLTGAVSLGAGTAGFLLAVVALLLICGCCCGSKKKGDRLLDRVSSSLGGSLITAAGMLVPGGHQGHYSPRPTSRGLRRSNPLLTVSPASRSSRLSIQNHSNQEATAEQV